MSQPGGSPSGDDTLWAVVASLGRATRIAEVHSTEFAAMADRNWRESQVKAYGGFLQRAQQPIPRYTVTRIRRVDLPRPWKPLPALGFLRGQFI